jgi:hypothetical protein
MSNLYILACQHGNPRGGCRECYEEEEAPAWRAAFIAKWRDPAVLFISGSARLHAKESRCHRLVWELDEKDNPDHGSAAAAWIHTPVGLRVDDLLNREQATAWLAKSRTRRRCRLCCPDIPEAIHAPARPRRKRTGVGWPA